MPETPNNKNITDSKIIEGGLAYISLEQIGRMNRNVNFHSDFYSLGVTLYEISTRQLPFTSDDPVELIHSHIARIPVNPSQVNPQLPYMVSEIIMKLMAKIPEDRYQGTFGLKSDLQECLNRYEHKPVREHYQKEFLKLSTSSTWPSISSLNQKRDLNWQN